MKKIISIITAMVLGVSMASLPVFAAKDCVDTAILGNGEVCDNGAGDSVVNILMLVVEIMTIGIGILGVIGISVVGIQYLTAGGNEEKTRKAKRRMLEIIIGLAVYAVFYAILQWLGVGS